MLDFVWYLSPSNFTNTAAFTKIVPLLTYSKTFFFTELDFYDRLRFINKVTHAESAFNDTARAVLLVL